MSQGILRQKIAELEQENTTLRLNYEGERQTVLELTKELNKTKLVHDQLKKEVEYYQKINHELSQRNRSLLKHVEIALRAAQRGAKSKKKASAVRQVRGILEAAVEDDAEHASSVSPWLPWIVGGAVAMWAYTAMKGVS